MSHFDIHSFEATFDLLVNIPVNLNWIVWTIQVKVLISWPIQLQYAKSDDTPRNWINSVLNLSTSVEQFIVINNLIVN